MSESSTELPDLEGKYEILRKLTEGGMGAIYKVRHRVTEEVRVVKVIHPEHAGDEALKVRFEREAKTALRLDHPNIARIYDFKMTADGTGYMVLEYIEGITVQELLRLRRPPSLGLALEIADQALGALAYLHGLGFIHRDIAPDNLMVSRDDSGSPIVKLIDLGVAKDIVAGSDLTISGTFLGKARYCAPEGFSGDSSKITAQSDLYSFGLVLYELLTGVLPIEGRTFSEIVAAHLFKPLLSFDESDPEGRISEGLRRTLHQALERSPQKRIVAAEALRQGLALHRRGAVPELGELDDVLLQGAARAKEEADARESGSSQERLDRDLPMASRSPITPAAPAFPVKSVADQLLPPKGADRTLVRDEGLPTLPLDQKAPRGRGWIWPLVGLIAAALAAYVIFFLL